MKLPYHEYEKTVFDWLMKKHKKNPNFTFSLRQMASKGAELDYFIGKEKSEYFATTFWSIHIGYPGSSNDLINVIFSYSENDLFSYSFKFNQTKSPTDNQNKSALDLIINLKPNLNGVFNIVSESDPKSKIEAYKLSPIKSSYSDIDLMMIDVINDVDKLIPIVNNAIEDEQKLNKSFDANQISKKEFEIFYGSMIKRFKKHGNITLPPLYPEDEKYNAYPNIYPLNQILFGPPGTGKTFQTVNEALKIADPDFYEINKGNRSLLKKRF